MLASGIKRYTVIRSHTVTEELRLPNVKKIVLAEDDDDDFHLFNSAILSIYSSIEILRTKNGIVFSSLMETSLKPDFIILDINMPFKDGITCLKEIE